ncbi:hypothetical protein N015_08310 [Pseudomonas asturiensis]|uniref:Uncharacterized protein n=1 Tax=Pseudomonas asturiensis TaxID=1190415 RepID=A0ABX6HAH3_9PSED|nr:hypothetical protein [Pseudomonas asturiensis]QHF02413.1 hypothetical protein N015_08310 [Pseudomonas asturiensis]
MHQTSEITVVLKAREGEHIGDLAPFLQVGSTVMIGRGGAEISALSTGDKVGYAEQLENQIVAAEQDPAPALRRLVSEVPGLYLTVSEEIKQQALRDGDDEEEAEEKAGQALRVLVMFKQRLEQTLEPDLLTTHLAGSLITENPEIAKTVENINDPVLSAADARRYRWLRDVALDTPRQDLALRDRHQNVLTDSDLDAEIDRAMQAYPRAWGQERQS